MHKIELSVSKRDTSKKTDTVDAVPGVVYGKGIESQPIAGDARILEKIYQEAGSNQVVELKIDEDKQIPVIFKEVQYDAVRGELRHFDLYAVDMTQAIEADVPVEFVGEAPAEATENVVVQLIDEISVSAKPADMPESFAVDISQLAEIGDAITVADLDIPEGVELHTEEDTVLIKVDAPREEEPEPVEEVEGEESEEGEATEGEESEDGDSAKEAAEEGETQE